MSLDLLQVVLVQTRFPENIGMAARACVNMGSHSIRLVAPERWDREKARPLATPKGQGVLDDVQVLPDVSAAGLLAGHRDDGPDRWLAAFPAFPRAGRGRSGPGPGAGRKGSHRVWP